MEIKRIASTDKEVAVDKKKSRMPTCEHCRTGGTMNLVKCSEQNCARYSHVYCLLKSIARQEKKKASSRDDTSNANWSFALNINDRAIEKKIHSKQRPSGLFNINSQRILDYINHVNKATDDANVSPKKGEEHSVKKKRGRKREMASKIDDSSMSQIYLNVVEKSSPLFKVVDGDEEFTEGSFHDLKNTIAKRISVQCAAHKAPETYCLCNSTSGDRVMLECDCCSNTLFLLYFDVFICIE